MSTRKSLGFGDKPRSSAKSSPEFRGNGRKPVPARRETQADTSDLSGKTSDELKEIAERDALRALIRQVRKPTRHATAVTSAARSLLEFSSSKPAQKLETDTTHRMEGDINIVLVRAKDGKRDEEN